MPARPPDPDVFVVGEALVDVVQAADGQTRRHPGGSPANVAVGLARLGRSVRFATQLGTDADGALVRDHLTESGVDVQATAISRTATAVARLDDHGAATYEFDLEWTVPRAGLVDPGAAVVHTGSIGALLEPGASAVAWFVDAHRDQALITFDPNLRPSLIGTADSVRPAVERLVGMVDVVKASDEDLTWLYPSATAENVARSWAASGPQLVVVTSGAADVVAFHGPVEHRLPTPGVDVVDTVGAGDAFMAGLIDGLLTCAVAGPDARSRIAALDAPAVARVIERANAVAAVTVSRPGADPPAAAELDADGHR